MFSWTLSESAAVLCLFACPCSQPGSRSGFAMTTSTTTTFKGVDPNGRNNSQVLRPPGGGSNFTLGFDEPTEQPVRKNKMASNIFGIPEENQPSWAKSAGIQSNRDNSELSGLQRRNSSEAGSGDFLGPKEEGDMHENVEADLQVDLGQNEEKSVPAAPVPRPVASAPAPSRRNPPGGKSSLVLG